LQGASAEFGALKCGCHPNCGIGTALLVNKRTKAMVPLAQFLNLERILEDMQRIADAGRSKAETLAAIAVSLVRNFDVSRAPEGYGYAEFVKQFLSQIGASGGRVGASEGGMALPVRRGDVVSGSVQLRLPAHRDVHHPLRHAAR
jgi:hypothetical protein